MAPCVHVTVKYLRFGALWICAVVFSGKLIHAAKTYIERVFQKLITLYVFVSRT